MVTDPIIANTPNQIAASRPGNYIAGPAKPNTNPYGHMDYSSSVNGIRVQNAPGVANGNFAPQASQTPPTPQVSTTTVSNANKINAAPAIQNTTKNLSTKGNTVDANGNTVASNGTIIPPPSTSDGTSTVDANGNPITPTTATWTDALGQIRSVGNGTPPAGSTFNGTNYVGPDGTMYPIPPGDTSYYDKQVFSALDNLKGQVSAQLATALDNIKAQYDNLITQQKSVNSSLTAKTQNALLMGGVTGQGSAAQYASTSSDQPVADQVSWGIQQISILNQQENQAIAAAQKAALDEDIQLQDQANTQINKARDAAQSIASKIQENLIAANQKVADAQVQQSKDSAIINILSPTDGTVGISDPVQILAKLKASGNTTVTMADITGTLKAISDNLNIQVDKLSGNMKDFQILKNMPGGLPPSILSLPADQQMAAYLKMINPPDQKGRYTIHDNPDGTVSVLDTATGKLMGGSGGTKGTPANLPDVSMNGTGNPNPNDQKAFLAALPKGQQTLIKGLADYTINPSSFPTRFTKGAAGGGLTQQQAIALAAQYDPTYDSKQYATRAAMQKNVTSGNYSTAINSANKVISHLSDLSKDIAALPNVGGVGTFTNMPVNTIRSFLGNPAQNNFNIDATAVANELAKVFKGTGSSDVTEIDSLRKTLDSNASPETQKDAITHFLNLMGGQLTTLSEQYKSIMGKPGNFNILTPASIVTLKSLGIDPATVDPTYNSITDVTGNGQTSDIGSNVQKALSSGYGSTDIINQIIKSNPDMADKVKQARDAGYKDDEIVNQLSQQ